MLILIGYNVYLYYNKNGEVKNKPIEVYVHPVTDLPTKTNTENNKVTEYKNEKKSLTIPKNNDTQVTEPIIKDTLTILDTLNNGE